MRWTKRLSENVKRGIRSWLNVQEASPTHILINEPLDYEANAIKNRIWYRGDSEELQQLYSQIDTGVDKYKFWACKSTPGQEIRKIHTGLPALVVDTLAGITLADLDIQIEKDREAQELWEQIDKDNKFRKKLEKAVKETLYIGDGAFKISFDTGLSQYPIIEFYPGDRIELITERGRIKEIVFKTAYKHNRQDYVLYEYYGYGTITYELYRGDTQVSLQSIPQSSNLVDVAFGTGKPEDKYMMAVPIQKSNAKPIAKATDSGIISVSEAKEVADVHTVGKIDKEIYKCVTKDIVTDEVIITDNQIQHIKDRHPNDYERFASYFDEIVKKPDYIIEANKPNTALILKEIRKENEVFKTVLRLVTSNDNPQYKNSIITFMKIDEKEWNRLLRNKNVLYRRE